MEPAAPKGGTAAADGGAEAEAEILLAEADAEEVAEAQAPNLDQVAQPMARWQSTQSSSPRMARKKAPPRPQPQPPRRPPPRPPRRPPPCRRSHKRSLGRPRVTRSSHRRCPGREHGWRFGGSGVRGPRTSCCNPGRCAGRRGMSPVRGSPWLCIGRFRHRVSATLHRVCGRSDPPFYRTLSQSARRAPSSTVATFSP